MSEIGLKKAAANLLGISETSSPTDVLDRIIDLKDSLADARSENMALRALCQDLEEQKFTLNLRVLEVETWKEDIERQRLEAIDILREAARLHHETMKEKAAYSLS